MNKPLARPTWHVRAKLGVHGTGVESSKGTGLWKMIPGGYRGTVQLETQLALYNLAWFPYSMARAVLLALRIQLRYTGPPC